MASIINAFKQLVSSSPSLESISIRMLSGEIIDMEVDLNQTISNFPQEFASRHGYNPKVLNRLEFLIDNPDGEVQHLLDTPQKTWSQRFTDGGIPLLHLFIQSPTSEDAASRISLIRSIAIKEKVKCDLSDEEIMEHYNFWYLTYQPPEKSNRYITLQSFVQSHSHLFPPFSQQDCVELEEQRVILLNQCEQIKLERQKNDQEINMLVSLRDITRYDEQEHEFIARLSRNKPEYAPTRVQVKEEFRQKMAEDPTGSFFVRQLESGDTQIHTEQWKHYRHYLTRIEMAEMGFNPFNVCLCSNPNCNSRIYAENSWQAYKARLMAGQSVSVPDLTREIRDYEPVYDSMGIEIAEIQKKISIITKQLGM
jgi:hypothetical protein